MAKIIIGNVEWMRNDFEADIEIGGIVYPTVEHAYQACKTTDRQTKQAIADSGIREARAIGRKLKSTDSDLETIDREKIMSVLLRKKFSGELGKSLANTGSDDIVMEGYDEYWGTGRDGNGENVMGQILEAIRSDLQILYGIDSEDEGGIPDEDIPTLKTALINNPDEELVTACQTLFDISKSVVSLIDKDDFNAEYISQKTGVPYDKIKEAIEVVGKFKEIVINIEDLLESPSDECDCEDEDDDEDDDSQID